MSKTQTPQLSIVLPFYNEKGNIATLLKEYESFKKNCEFELVCVNNGSTDGSEKIFQEFSKKKKFNFIKIVTIKKNIGYGHGIMTGVKKSRGTCISWTHADRQTDPKDIFWAYDVYRKQKDNKVIVKGNRKGRPILDTIVSNCMGVIATLLLRTPLYEINAQPKLFHRSFLSSIINPPDDFLLDTYFLYTAKMQKYKIKSINVKFNKRIYGKSKWAYSWRSRLWMVKRTINYMLELSNKRF